MKFGHSFEEVLQKEGFPPQWVGSAIGYKQLKKCIKKVEDELLSLGLDRDTMKILWRSINVSGTPGVSHPVIEYSLGGSNSFNPRILLVVDPKNENLIDATLSPETRICLQNLVRFQRKSSQRMIELLDDSPDNENAPLESIPESESFESRETFNSTEVHQEPGINADVLQHGKIIEIPLVSNSNFFQMLTNEIADLDTLHEQEEHHLEQSIGQLGDKVSRALDIPKKRKESQANLYAWRKIFALYMESDIFFSSKDSDRGSRTSLDAAQRLNCFIETVSKNGLNATLNPRVCEGLYQFLSINQQLLKMLKFQEINKTALTKILKKFDKHTALRASQTFPRAIATESFMMQSIAKEVCARISQEILPMVPQVFDYQCPICCDIAWRPVKLRCGHIFCIRCLVVMQRENQDHCPLCRGSVVMQADSDNIDRELVKFLKEKFPHEVKEKQKDNEYQTGVDLYGPDFKKTYPCIIM